MSHVPTSVTRNASFLDTVKTVLSGFLGVRRKADHERVRLNPAYIILTAVLFVVIFVLTLRAIVSIVVS